MTYPIAEEDLRAGFTCGQHDLDQFFAKHALVNDQQGIGRTFVMRRSPGADGPPILGYFTLSMATITRTEASGSTVRLPRYALPVALGCLGIVVDAKDAKAERFYGRYGFTSFTGTTWPKDVSAHRDSAGSVDSLTSWFAASAHLIPARCDAEVALDTAV